MAKIIQIHIKRKGVSGMATPGIVGNVIAELYARGLERELIAEKLGVKLPVVSQLKNGRTTLGDSKFVALADLHGSLSARELLTLKWLEWLEREKGITIVDIEHVTSVVAKSRLRARRKTA